ncbi:NuA4 histone acetyltransferase complex subunit Vid21 [Schizosaccharomyces japonicus yFS275]|uniref:Vacuolar import and degradation protein 21 n=1 Tax=Schizosaccharomyces japonicus (strain yFS275 / FY16936) TaxID=402676 RepID=B6JWK6_SCHJY|nr:NuA4 histone acetyltransferase complex subunit Vid21 [Schizosaccharomyces japonicus yFS275]EEB05757.1 NuA4 histone acetyltransferase complex subunit Vid21 [Schizosaccharomyces japonicus yFS275]
MGTENQFDSNENGVNIDETAVTIHTFLEKTGLDEKPILENESDHEKIDSSLQQLKRYKEQLLKRLWLLTKFQDLNALFSGEDTFSEAQLKDWTSFVANNVKGKFQPETLNEIEQEPALSTPQLDALVKRQEEDIASTEQIPEAVEQKVSETHEASAESKETTAPELMAVSEVVPETIPTESADESVTAPQPQIVEPKLPEVKEISEQTSIVIEGKASEEMRDTSVSSNLESPKTAHLSPSPVLPVEPEPEALPKEASLIIDDTAHSPTVTETEISQKPAAKEEVVAITETVEKASAEPQPETVASTSVPISPKHVTSESEQESVKKEASPQGDFFPPLTLKTEESTEGTVYTAPAVVKIDAVHSPPSTQPLDIPQEQPTEISAAVEVEKEKVTETVQATVEPEPEPESSMPVEPVTEEQLSVPETQVEETLRQLPPSELDLRVTLPSTLIAPEPVINRTRDGSVESWLLRTEMQPLQPLVELAHKCVRTEQWMHVNKENILRHVLLRVKALKDKQQWSFCQPIRAKSLPRKKSHHDFLLEEMQWLSMDFSQERQWKMVMAKRLAYWVLDYHNAEDKKSLCVKRNSPASASLSEPSTSKSLDTSSEAITAEPDIAGDAVRLFEAASSDEPLVTISNPQIMFALNSVPLYAPPDPSNDSYINTVDQFPFVPLSRFSLAKTKLKSECNLLPRKRSQHLPELHSKQFRGEVIESEEFNEHRRKRIHFILTIRPPCPPFKRDSSEASWSPEEDELLLSLLNRYSYNWDFVSRLLTPSGLYITAKERRTAWSCFERWVQIDPQAANAQLVGTYARLAQQRLDELTSSNTNSERHINNAIKDYLSANTKASSLLLPSVSRNYQQSLIFDAMRKVIKKRELAKKAALSRKVISRPKANTENPPPVPSPLELSRLKSEREAQLQQVQAQRNAALLMQYHAQGRTPHRGMSSPTVPLSRQQMQQFSSLQSSGGVPRQKNIMSDVP